MTDAPQCPPLDDAGAAGLGISHTDLRAGTIVVAAGSTEVQQQYKRGQYSQKAVLPAEWVLLSATGTCMSTLQPHHIV
jgi:hypothetical protein